MLQTVDRLPIPNKTMVQESRFFIIVERWLTTVDIPPPAADNLFIDEATGKIYSDYSAHKNITTISLKKIIDLVLYRDVCCLSV